MLVKQILLQQVMKIKFLKLCVTALVAASFIISDARADIDGFNFLVGWSQNREADGPPLSLGDDFVRITSGGNQYRSLWFNAKQDITQFSATFRYRVEDIGGQGSEGGVFFVVQNDPRETAALSPFFFGYGNGLFEPSIGVQPSAAITIESRQFALGKNGTFSGSYENGDFTDVSPSIEPTTAFMFTDVLVSITYDGNLMNVVMDDQVNEPYEITFSLPELDISLGSPNTYVGFTAGASGFFNSGATQVISNFQFVELGSDVLLGDVNQDKSVDLLDVAPFVDLINAGKFQEEADINQDGVVDLLDVAPFVALLTGE